MNDKLTKHNSTLVYIAVAVLTLSNIAFCQPPAMPDISNGWKFNTGDDPSWSKPALDDSNWRTIRVGTAWDDQGISDYDGYAWYRLRIAIPASLRNDPNFMRHQALKITLGKIDDVDRTWFNGEQIGSTGAFPEAYSPAWQTTRSYLIPAQLVRWNQDNLIAVRVYDGNGEGGMVGGPYRLEIATWSDAVEIAFDLGRGDGIFSTGQKLPIHAALTSKLQDKITGQLKWTVKDDEGATLFTDSVAAVIAAQGELRASCPFAPEDPGFYRAKCELHSGQHDTIKSETINLGFKPETVAAPLTREADFDEFWKRTLQALDEVAPEFKLTRHADQDSETHEVYEVEMRSLDKVRVRGWYQKPKATGSYPALLRVPGYGEDMRPIDIQEPMAVFSFNIRAHGNSQDDVSGEPSDYWIRGLDDKWGYFYQGAYADCVRAVDFLASREEVDQTRIAVTGGSQGGGLSLVTAALDQRISLCAPDIPFLCDWVKYFKTTDWPEMNEWVEKQSDRTWESTLRTMSYFDALNFADRIRCPVLVGLGLQDDVCPPATIFSVYNRLSVPKEYRVYPHAGHWVDAAHNDQRRKWILNHLSPGE